MGNIITTETQVVWTKNDGAAVDHVFTEAMSSAGVEKVRLAIELRQVETYTEGEDELSYVEAQGYYQYSGDLETWDTPVLFGDPVVTLPGMPVFEPDYTNISENAKPHLRLGIRFKKKTGADAALYLGYASMRIEMREG